MTGTALQVLGYGLMSSVSKARGTPAAIYGYEVFLGLGFGMCIASATIMVPVRFKALPQYVGTSISPGHLEFMSEVLIEQQLPRKGR